MKHLILNNLEADEGIETSVIYESDDNWREELWNMVISESVEVEEEQEPLSPQSYHTTNGTRFSCFFFNFEKRRNFIFKVVQELVLQLKRVLQTSIHENITFTMSSFPHLQVVL